jgi:hypothetical protein
MAGYPSDSSLELISPGLFHAVEALNLSEQNFSDIASDYACRVSGTDFGQVRQSAEEFGEAFETTAFSVLMSEEIDDNERASCLADLILTGNERRRDILREAEPSTRYPALEISHEDLAWNIGIDLLTQVPVESMYKGAAELFTSNLHANLETFRQAVAKQSKIDRLARRLNKAGRCVPSADGVKIGLALGAIAGLGVMFEALGETSRES